MRQKKKTFTLLELLITLPLVSFLISTTLKSYTECALLSKTLHKKNESLRESIYFSERMKKMISSISFEKLTPSFQNNRFEFEYDNGINRIPRASNTVSAALFVDEGKLILEVHKTHEKETLKIRQEIFFQEMAEFQIYWGYIKENRLLYSQNLNEAQNPLALKIILFKKIDLRTLKNTKSSKMTYFFEL